MIECKNTSIDASICSILDHINLNTLHYTYEIRDLINLLINEDMGVVLNKVFMALFRNLIFQNVPKIVWTVE